MTPEEFLDNIGVLTEALDGMGKLREMILELAFQGRLVAPVASDESASELVQQILQGRGRPTIDKISSPPIVSADTLKSPAHWSWVRLGQIAEITGGVTKGRNLAGRDVASYPYLRVANVQRGFLNLDVMKEIEIPAEELNKYQLRRGDLLFTEGGDWDKLGRSAVWEEQLPTCLHQNHIFKARLLSPKLSPRWFSLFANSPGGKHYFANAAKQTTNLASINITQLRNLPTPVPPALEQTRILAKVDQLMAICDELEARQTKQRETSTLFTQSALDALTSAEGPEEFARAWQRVSEHFEELSETPESTGMFRRSVLHLAMQGRFVPQRSSDDDVSGLRAKIALARRELISKHRLKDNLTLDPIDQAEVPYPLPIGWQWIRLGELGIFLGGGTPSKGNPSFWKGSIPWVSPKDMKKPYIDDAQDHISESAVKGSAVKQIPVGSLLFVVRGMILAHSFPTALTLREVTINQDMKALVLAMPELGEFILRACQALKERILQKVARSSHGTCRLESKELEQLLIPLPPLTEQQRIIAKVDQLMTLCDTLESKLQDTEKGAQLLAEAMAAEMVA